MQYFGDIGHYIKARIPKVQFQGGMFFPSSARCSHRNDPQIFLRVLEDVGKDHFYAQGLYLPQKNFTAMKSSKCSVFWRWESYWWLQDPFESLTGWVWNLKNHRLRTFAILDCDWSVVRPSRLFLRIDMILSKLTNTHVRWWWPTENFFAPLKAILYTR